MESNDASVERGGRRSAGVVADFKGSEKIYLHVLPVSDAEIASLAPRVDQHRNAQHDRLSLPRDEIWWIAVDGEAFWPKVFAPRIRSRCDLAGPKPVPAPLTSSDLSRLAKSGVGAVPAG